VLKPGGVFVALEIQDGWLTRVAHFRSTFVPVTTNRLNSRLLAAGFSNVSVNNQRGAIRIRAERVHAHRDETNAQKSMTR
jgi:hypothetical protein